jgi:hypothetical protein
MSRKQKYKRERPATQIVEFTYPFSYQAGRYHFPILESEGVRRAFRYVEALHPGWWLCRYEDPTVSVIRPAEPWERNEAAQQWTASSYVLVKPWDQSGLWLALPLNEQMNWATFQPIQMMTIGLVENGQPFERIIARTAPGTISVFDELDRRADPFYAEYLRDALAAQIPDPGFDAFTVAEQLAYAHLLELQLQGTMARDGISLLAGDLRQALTLADAKLIGIEAVRWANQREDLWKWQRNNFNYRVTWEYRQERGVVIVDEQLNVVTAGICLSGRDHDFDMASVINVIKQGPRRDQYFGNVEVIAAE